MRTLFIICSILASLTAFPALALDKLTKSQCDAFIANAFRVQDREFGLKLLNSKTSNSCFQRFPALDEKYFPARLKSADGLPDTSINNPMYSKIN